MNLAIVHCNVYVFTSQAAYAGSELGMENPHRLLETESACPQAGMCHKERTSGVLHRPEC